MAEKKRMKLCSSCEGFVDIDVVACPYCGNDLLKDANSKKENPSPTTQHKKRLSVEETLSSLYPPPYKPKNIPLVEPEHTLEKDISGTNSSFKLNLLEEDLDNNKDNQPKSEEKPKSALSVSRCLPVILFSLGVNILLLALYLLIFSTNGEIFIRWNGELWYVYLITGIPLTFIGYKMLSKVL